MTPATNQTPVKMRGQEEAEGGSGELLDTR
jgi:hypothetical protein